MLPRRYPITVKPASIRLAAIGSPILPSPTMPTFIRVSLLLASTEEFGVKTTQDRLVNAVASVRIVDGDGVAPLIELPGFYLIGAHPIFVKGVFLSDRLRLRTRGDAQNTHA